MGFITYTCNRCKAEWLPRTINPRRCPICQTPYWKDGKKKGGSKCKTVKNT